MPLRVLIVEDEFLVALHTQDELEHRGHVVVGIAPTVQSALDRIARQPIDFAILDVNLRGQHVAPVARELLDRGVPFIYATAYGTLLDGGKEIDDVPVLNKPYSADELYSAISCVMRGGALQHRGDAAEPERACGADRASPPFRTPLIG